MATDQLPITEPPGQAELIAHHRAMQQRLTEIELAERSQVLEWSALLCSCALLRTPGQPSWVGCIVHGQFAITPDGRVV